LEIAVIGGGNGAYAAAADLTERGHRIRLWRRDAAGLAALREAGALTLRDAAGARDIRLALVSDDLGAALEGAALVIVPLPAFAQHSIAAALAPHLADGQIVLLSPGSFGSLVIDRGRRGHGNRADIAFAETGTLPYLARKHGPCEIVISGRATRLPTGVYPAARSAETFDILRRAYPAIETLSDALDGALMNAGPIIHPPLILMNAGPVEHFPHWDIHAEGTQPSIRRVTDALDAERIATRIALGYDAPHFPLADHYSASGEECMAAARMTDWSRAATGASISTSSPIATCARTSPAASPSSSRWRNGPGCPARWRAASWRSARQSSERISAPSAARWRILPSPIFRLPRFARS
jgi:opine dehydrogenase